MNYGAPLSNPAGSPAEFLLGGWYRILDRYVLRVGAGTGLNSGVGAPDARLVVGIAYEPEKIFDRDLDTIVDSLDVCPDSPEDFDEYEDTDGCPDPSTTVYFEIVDGDGEYVYDAVTVVRTEFGTREEGSAFDLPMHPGEYTIEASAARYTSMSTLITVPEAGRHEVRLQLEPTFGTLQLRVRGPDGEKIAGRANVVSDRCTLAEGRCEFKVNAGPGTLVVRAEGYKTQQLDVTVVAGETAALTIQLESARAVVTQEKIEILEKVFFNTAKTTIQALSYPLLDEVAGILKEYPDIRSLRVEGHTDSRGGAGYNLRLSQGRADAVRQYLIDKGIDPSRLVSQGYGEDRPIDPASTDAAYEQNRRVEFVILERDAPSGQGTP
jgi:outer membrane protein OmpA-like peptidoglycan-associated protein